MSKLNVTEGEWEPIKHLYNGSYNIVTGFLGSTEVAYIAASENDAQLMTQSKNLYNEVQAELNALIESLQYIPEDSGEYEHVIQLIGHKEKLLAKCRGEQ